MSERTERLRRIVLLLQHRLDYLDGAIRIAQSFPSKPGAVPSHKVACGSARLEAGAWKCSPNCAWCNGTGFRRRLVIDGDATSDERGAIFDEYTYAYDRADKAGESSQLRVMEAWEVDRELARLRADKRARAGVHLKTDAYGWEKARERRDRSGSFRELDRALDALSIQHPGLSALLVNIFRGVYGPTSKREDSVGGSPFIPVGAGRAYWQALCFIEARMPDTIRVPQHLSDADSGLRRRERVTETYRRTNSISKTAHSHGMRKARVKEILRDAGLIAA